MFWQVLLFSLIGALSVSAETGSGLNFQATNLPSPRLIPPALKAQGKESAKALASNKAGAHHAIPAKVAKQAETTRGWLRPRVRQRWFEAASWQARDKETHSNFATPHADRRVPIKSRSFFEQVMSGFRPSTLRMITSNTDAKTARPRKSNSFWEGLSSAAHRNSTTQSPSSGGLWNNVFAKCCDSPLPVVGVSIAESLCRAYMELACSQNRFLTLGVRIGRELLLTLREEHSTQSSLDSTSAGSSEEHAEVSEEHAEVESKEDEVRKGIHAGGKLHRILWACKEALLLTWLENVQGICAVRPPEPLRLSGKNAGRAIIGRAMRLWGQDVTQRIIHGPLRARSRFSLGRISRIMAVLGSACAGAGMGALSAAACGASAPDAALTATATAGLVSAAAFGAVSNFGVDTGLSLSAADANALLLATSFLGLGLVGGRYLFGTSSPDCVHFSGCFSNGCHEDKFVNPFPSAIFGPVHEDKMSVWHMLACAPFSIADPILACMGYMPASLRMAMRDSRVRDAALDGGALGGLEAHSLGTLEARLLKANMAWAGTMVLLSPPPPFGWEEGTVRHCGRFDPICSGPLMSVAKQLAAPVTYHVRDISRASDGIVHMRPTYRRHMSVWVSP